MFNVVIIMSDVVVMIITAQLYAYGNPNMLIQLHFDNFIFVILVLNSSEGPISSPVCTSGSACRVHTGLQLELAHKKTTIFLPRVHISPWSLFDLIF